MPWIRRVVTQVVGAYWSTSSVALGVAPKRLRGSPHPEPATCMSHAIDYGQESQNVAAHFT
eukprot:4780336-Prymnesium_polylepis.1